MLAKEIHEYILNLELCHICVLRYKNVDDQNFEQIFEEFQNRKTVEAIKRSRWIICAACMGMFHALDTVKNIIENSNLTEYDCTSLYTSVQIPINISIRDLSIWIALIEKFPGKICLDKAPCISIKDAYKYLLNKMLSQATNRTIEHNQNGILVNLFYGHDLEKDEIEKLLAVKPFSMGINKR